MTSFPSGRKSASPTSSADLLKISSGSSANKASKSSKMDKESESKQLDSIGKTLASEGGAKEPKAGIKMGEASQAQGKGADSEKILHLIAKLK